MSKDDEKKPEAKEKVNKSKEDIVKETKKRITDKMNDKKAKNGGSKTPEKGKHPKAPERKQIENKSPESMPKAPTKGVSSDKSQSKKVPNKALTDAIKQNIGR